MSRIGMIGVLLVGTAVPAVAWATPSEALWKAMTHVESRGNAKAYNPRDGAAGVIQIRSIAVKDLNRIARRRGLEVRYTLADRYDSAKSREMWRLYLAYYGAYYAKRTGETPTDEVYARIWNGGPSGWAKNATRAYWDRVRAALE